MNESKRGKKLNYPGLGRSLVAMALCAAAFPARSAELPGLDCVIEPHEVVELGSPTHGVIETIYVDRNSLVKKGQVLAELESDVERATVSLASARADLTAEIQLRRAALGFDQRNQARIEELHQKKAVPLHVKDETDTDAQKSRLQLLKANDAKRLAALDLVKAKAVLQLRTIRSPIDGVVVARHKAPGEFIEEDSILRLAQIDPLRVEVIVPVELFGAIKEGMQAEVMPELERDTAYTATVTMVDRVIDAASGTFDVRLELPNPDYRIPSGLKCDVRFVPDTRPLLAETADSSMDEIVLDTLSEPAAELPAAVDVAAEVSAPQADIAQSSPGKEIAPEMVAEAPDYQVSSQESAQTPAPQSSPKPSLAQASLAQASPESAKSLPEVSSCRMVGPLESSEQADRLAAALADQATRISRQQQTESVIDSYMVLAPLQPTPEATEQLKARLRDKGIKDVYVLPRGENKNRISLGVYQKKSWAERRKAQLAEVGFQVQVGVRTKSRPQYWLNVEMSADNANELKLLKTVDRIAPEQKLTLGPCAVSSHLAETAESEETI